MLIGCRREDFTNLSQAMRFPMNQHRLELKNAQEARERERELAKEIVDGEMDDDDAPGGDFEGL
jgi:26S proteasome regulatory subunit N3